MPTADFGSVHGPTEGLGAGVEAISAPGDSSVRMALVPRRDARRLLGRRGHHTPREAQHYAAQRTISFVREWSTPLDEKND